MKRIDKIVEVASLLSEARAVVVRLERQLGALLGDASSAPDERPSKDTTPVTKPAGRARRGERMAQVAELAEAGLDSHGIATKLGISIQAARMTLTRARRNALAGPKGLTNGHGAHQ